MFVAAPRGRVEMGGGASKATAAAVARKTDTRLSLTELQRAASERLDSSWWLQDNRIVKLFELLDADKNGSLQVPPDSNP